jgi:N6-L-threonylcarbamoyladenine synthase
MGQQAGAPRGRVHLPGATLNVLAIESSCDETAVAVWGDGLGLRAHEVYSQTDLHAVWGGVVPELASRDHVRCLTPMISRVLATAGLAPHEIDGVVYTAGPGLIGALLVGAGVAKSLSYAWQVPVLGVNHLEGHLLSPLLEADPPAFPYLALLVSGGHTMLVDVQGLGRYRVLGESLDDAAGEAFDKTAKLLGLPYPGGARLAALAATGQAGRFRFPRPMLDRPGFDFSFSGLKTAALLALRGHEHDPVARADLARAFEDALVETLATKTARALRATGRTALVVAGGVGANAHLRGELARVAAEAGARTAYPRAEFCTDNAAMIALVGHARLSAGERAGPGDLARARWSIEELVPPSGISGASVA